MSKKDLVELIVQKQMVPYALIKGFNMKSEVGDDEWALPKGKRVPTWIPDVDVLRGVDKGAYRGYKTSRNQLKRNEEGY